EHAGGEPDNEGDPDVAAGVAQHRGRDDEDPGADHRPDHDEDQVSRSQRPLEAASHGARPSRSFAPAALRMTCSVASRRGTEEPPLFSLFFSKPRAADLLRITRPPPMPHAPSS